MKRDAKTWLKIVHEYLDKGTPMTVLSKKYDVDLSKIKYRVNLFKMHGEEPFTDRQEKRIYTREEKLEVIKIILSGKKSGRQIALEKGIPNPHTVQDWVAKYKREGEASIQVSRGRKKYMLHEDRQRYLADKELKARCKYLEDENEFLKKSLALALKKDKRLKKKYKSLMSLRAKSN